MSIIYWLKNRLNFPPRPMHRCCACLPPKTIQTSLFVQIGIKFEGSRVEVQVLEAGMVLKILCVLVGVEHETCNGSWNPSVMDSLKIFGYCDMFHDLLCLFQQDMDELPGFALCISLSFLDIRQTHKCACVSKQWEAYAMERITRIREQAACNRAKVSS